MELKYVMTDQITLGPNVRKQVENIAELAASIAKHGIISPISLVHENGKYRILHGERRYWAAIKAKLSSVPAMVYEKTFCPSEEDRVVSQLIENIQREDLHPLDLSAALVQLQSMNGWSTDRLARELGKSAAWVSNIKVIASKLTREEKAMVREMPHPPSLTTLAAAARTKDPEARQHLLQEGVSQGEAQVVRRRLSSRKPPFRLKIAVGKATVTVAFKKAHATKAETLRALANARVAVQETPVSRFGATR